MNYQIDDPAMHQLVDENQPVRKLQGDFQFIEGPIWIGDRLVFSDIPASTLFQLKGDKISEFRKPSFSTNGNTLDAEGHLLSCEHESRVVSITEPAIGGERRVLVETFDNEGTETRFNSPNDIVAHSGGVIYFTDPYWGLPGDRREELMEYGGCWVFCFKDGKASPVAKDFGRPNGLALSPDEKTLYIADDQHGHIRKFTIEPDDTLSGGEVHCETDNGIPDGFRVAAGGEIFSSAGDGVHIFDTAGKRLGKILVPETPANCCFGGEDGRTLFITARTGLYAVKTKTTGATLV